MRLIDATALKKDACTKCWINEINCRACMCIPLIDKQPTINQWIPVSERLPQASKHILFSVKGKSYTSYGFHNDGIWTDINGAWYTDKEVNAWMPLPSPYKESENND